MATESASGAGWAITGAAIMIITGLGMIFSWSTFNDTYGGQFSGPGFGDWIGTQGANLSAFALGMVIIQLGNLIDAASRSTRQQ